LEILRQSWSQTQRELLVKHFHVPVAKGSRASDLSQTVSGLVHSWRLECITEDVLRNFYESLMTHTTDLGVEGGVAEYPDVETEHLVAEGHLPEIIDDSGAPAEGPQQQNPDDPDGHQRFLFPWAMAVPGLLHILANALQQVHKSFDFWDTYVSDLSACASFLHVSDNRKRLQNQCFTGHLFCFRPFFETACPLVIEWRWLIVMQVLKHLLMLENALDAGWEFRKYLAANPLQAVQGQGAEAEANSADHLAKLKKVDGAFRSRRSEA
jgi:hypothetical protein